MTEQRGPEIVGRREALEAVASWSAGLANGPSCLLITGEAGIGKTAVWEAALAAAADRGARVLVARPVEAEIPLGYASLADLFAGAIAAIQPGLPAVQAEALGLALRERAAGRADPLVVCRAVLSTFEALSAERPVVIAVDDVQWLDAASARALAYAARRLDASRCSFLLTLRRGTAEPIEAERAFGGRLRTIELGGLTLGAIGHLVRVRVDPDVSRRRVARIQEQSGGNPLHALQLARATEDGLPDSLMAGLSRQLDAAPPGSLDVLERIAVLGPLSLASLNDPTEADDAVAAGLLVESGSTVRYAHPLLAEAAHQRIPPGRRRSLHRRAADAAETDVARARHLALAIDAPDAGVAAFLEATAKAQRRRGDPDMAADLAAVARRLMPRRDASGRARLAVDQADYLFLAAEEASAAALVEEVLAGGATGATRVRALVHHALGRPDAASAVAALELAVAEKTDDRVLEARTLAQLAWQRGAWLGEVEAALPEAERAVQLAEATGDAHVLATALTTSALLLSFARGTGAAGRFERAVQIVSSTPNEAGDHTPHLAFAHERFWRGDFATAEHLLDLDRARALEHGDEGELMRLGIFVVEFEIRRGRWNEAARLLPDAIAGAQGYWRLLALTRRGLLRARRGDPDALADAEELETSPAASGEPTFASAAAFIRGLAAQAEGRTAEAAALMAVLPEQVDAHAPRAAEFGILIPEAVIALATDGQLDRGRRLAAQLERRLPIFEPWGRGAVDLCEGNLLLAAGDPRAALGPLEGAVECFDRLGAAWELGLALLSLGRARRRIGQRTASAAVLEQAAGIFAKLGAGPAAGLVQRELRGARPRRRSDDRLTDTEGRVADLAAQGRSNREIAAALFVGVTTVEAHLTRIYSKLGLRSRTQLARAVMDGRLELNATDERARPATEG